MINFTFVHFLGEPRPRLLGHFFLSSMFAFVCRDHHFLFWADIRVTRFADFFVSWAILYIVATIFYNYKTSLQIWGFFHGKSSTKKGWAVFWAIFSETHLATLASINSLEAESPNLYCYGANPSINITTLPGANPTCVSYNASVPKIYSTTYICR
jgi:hypothetical protein